MSILQATVTLDDIVSWGPPSDWDPRSIRAFFRHANALTVQKVLETDITASVRFWVVMRESLIPARHLHAMTQDLVERFLVRARGDGVYVDYRTARAIDAKRRWIDHEISGGALAYARQNAQAARDLVCAADDPRAWSVASAACHACREDDPRAAFRSTFYTTLDLHGQAADQQACVDGVLSYLASLEHHA